MREGGLGPRGNADSVHAKKLHGEGTRYDVHTYGRTLRLLDRIGPVGHLREKHFLKKRQILCFKEQGWSSIILTQSVLLAALHSNAL